MSNPPAASHMGGVSEIQIRSPSVILSSLLLTLWKSLNEESLMTLVTETEGILNLRPPTAKTIKWSVSFSSKYSYHEILRCYASTKKFWQSWFVLSPKVVTISTHSKWTQVTREERIPSIISSKINMAQWKEKLLCWW